MLTSAIPTHLQCTRTQPAGLPAADFQPPYPSYSVRFPEKVSDLVMAIIGAQFKTDDATKTAAAQSTLTTFLTSPNSPPTFFEWATVTDAKGYYNLSTLAYWPSKAVFETWATDSGFNKWWESLDPTTCSHGWFLEIFFPTTNRFETLFNTTANPEGSAYMRETMSEEVREHGYWGSMRDRLPIAQTDPLVSSLSPSQMEKSSSSGSGNENELCTRVTIPGRKNLTVIRSGQDWGATTPEERQLYLETMHPVLTRGMDFLRDHGREEDVGCFSCRFMTSTGKDRTFGLAYFQDLASLERWCREHETHLAIFRGFHAYAKKLNNQVTLKVFHEVMVLEEEQQRFEYVACHKGTGMLA